MNRQAVYSQRSEALRIACVSNDRWVLQKRMRANSKAASGWENVHQPTTYFAAMEQLDKAA